MITISDRLAMVLYRYYRKRKYLSKTTMLGGTNIIGAFYTINLKFLYIGSGKYMVTLKPKPLCSTVLTLFISYVKCNYPAHCHS